MAQTQKVSGVATQVRKEGLNVSVQYHRTVVASMAQKHLNAPRVVTLNSGGWQTATTKTRINQFSNEFCNGRFRVTQEKGDWYVYLFDAAYSANGELMRVPFADGLTFPIDEE